MTTQPPESPIARTVRLALSAGRKSGALARVRALQETWAASADWPARHHARLLGEALDGPGRESRELDYGAIHDHVADEEDDDA